jgi:hypothetical protein
MKVGAKAIEKPSQDAGGSMAQPWLQHISINSYLHRFKRADKDGFPACSEENRNTVHFLLRCQAETASSKDPCWKAR